MIPFRDHDETEYKKLVHHKNHNRKPCEKKSCNFDVVSINNSKFADNKCLTIHELSYSFALNIRYRIYFRNKYEELFD